MEKETLYKVLNKDFISPYQGFEFEIGKEYCCEDFDTNTNNECSRGFYAVDFDGLSYAYRQDKIVCECEVWGVSVEINEFKRRYEYIKVIRKLTLKEIKDGLKRCSTDAGYNLLSVSFPIDPQKKKRVVNEQDIELLKEWASVRASVWDSVGVSVWASVWASVWNSVWNSVWDSVWNSVWNSLGDSVGAYISSFFPNIEKWKYIDHEEWKNPFESCIKLWKRGLVPSFDGKTWRLHTGKEAKIVYEWTPEEK